MDVRANADTPRCPGGARNFGATGIGLFTRNTCSSCDRIVAVREMILATDEAGRRKALAKLLPMQRSDFEGMFREMNGLPVTIRLLDPPLHEFIPHDEAGQRVMANEMGVPLSRIRMRVEELHGIQSDDGAPGLPSGHQLSGDHRDAGARRDRGGAEHEGRGVDVKAEIMVPLVGTVQEFDAQAKVIRQTAAAVFKERGEAMPFEQ